MSMDYTYKLNLKVNSQQIVVHMENHRNGEKGFDVTLTLKAQEHSSMKKVFWRDEWS